MPRIRDWRSYWNSKPQSFEPADRARQAEWTIGGEPLPADDVFAHVAEIVARLELTHESRLLDLCCGNGLITELLADHCAGVVGVDFSEYLLEVAEREAQHPSVRYQWGNAVSLGETNPPLDGNFDRVLMLGSLQYFLPDDLDGILAGLVTLVAPGAVILLRDIPHRRRKWHFYRTGRQRLTHLWNSIGGQDALGTWWEAEWIESRARSMGWSASFLVSADPDSARYRFDAQLRVPTLNSSDAVSFEADVEHWRARER